MTIHVDRVAALRLKFESHGLGSVPDHHLEGLEESARMNVAAAGRKWRSATPAQPYGWPQEDRKAALAHVTKLLDYASNRRTPREPGTRARRCQNLANLTDHFYVTVLLLANGFNQNSLLDALRRGNPPEADLVALREAIQRLKPAKRTGRRMAPFVRLIRGTALAWLDCGQPEAFGAGLSVTSSGDSRLSGAFAALLRDVFDALEVKWPGDVVIRQHLLALPAWLEEVHHP